MSKQRECIVALLFALVSAVSVLLIATTSSPLYATNFWTDTNIYFTIGRGMKHGFMPYTDLFDHKGPLLYMIYAVAAVISENSFVGVFLLEVLSLAAFLYLAYKTVGLFGEGMLNLISIPCTAVLTVTCTAFNQGGCAEEFILPALMLALYTVLKRFEQGSNCLKQAYLYVAFGASVGWVFATKYTNCGLFFGLAFSLFLYEWRLNGFVRAVVCGLYALGWLCCNCASCSGIFGAQWCAGCLHACVLLREHVLICWRIYGNHWAHIQCFGVFEDAKHREPGYCVYGNAWLHTALFADVDSASQRVCI